MTLNVLKCILPEFIDFSYFFKSKLPPFHLFFCCFLLKILHVICITYFYSILKQENWGFVVIGKDLYKFWYFFLIGSCHYFVRYDSLMYWRL